MLSGTREKDTPKERSSSPREARSAPQIAQTPAPDETRKLSRHVRDSCLRCGTSISTAWRRALRCAASARQDCGPLHARTQQHCAAQLERT